MSHEHSRMMLVQALSEKLGPEVAAALLECVPPFPWTELPTKTDLRELEQRLVERFDTRMDAQKFELLAAIQTQANHTIKWMVGSVFGAIAAIGGATAGILALVR